MLIQGIYPYWVVYGQFVCRVIGDPKWTTAPWCALVILNWIQFNLSIFLVIKVVKANLKDIKIITANLEFFGVNFHSGYEVQSA